uniref:Ankyrin repeat domain 60 n=1 Tax=Lepisosteus oculatus TaxID=7918 RepID=W5MJJ3_LEPOC|nr:PREDICTED: ankyrin repeat domain-containing protein 60 [Lepisosteus oculatus]
MAAPSQPAPRRDSRRAAKAAAAVVTPDKDSHAGGPFGLRVRLRDTGELYSVAECRAGTRVKELKTALELVAGIPTEFQRLSYLDEGDMPDESTLRFNDVVPGGTVTLTVWRQGGWAELVRAAAAGDVPRLQSLLPRGSSLCASRDCGAAPEMTAWQARRAFSALFISAHRGHLPAVRFLLHNGKSRRALQRPSSHCRRGGLLCRQVRGATRYISHSGDP